MPAKNKLTVFEHRQTLIEVFEEEQWGEPKQCTVKIECVLNEEGHSSIYEVLPTLTVGEVKENFNFKHVNFRCVESETGSYINQAIDVLTSAAEAATTTRGSREPVSFTWL